MTFPPEGLTPDEIQGVKYLKTLIELEMAGEQTTIKVGPYTAMMVIGFVQLATRHPEMDPKLREIGRDFVRQFEPLFKGTPGEEMIRRGGHPEWDQ